MRRWLKLRARARYWKRRALRAETQLNDTLAALDAETVRNREREDTFVSASILGHHGMYGMPPRQGPAISRRQPQAPPPVNYGAGWDAGFTWADKEEFKLEWLPVVNAGTVSLQQAQQDFKAEIARRRIPLNDDPYNN